MAKGKDKRFYSYTSINKLSVPVDAAAAPSRIGGIPNTSKKIAATKHVSLVVANEEADKVLWWKS